MHAGTPVSDPLFGLPPNVQVPMAQKYLPGERVFYQDPNNTGIVQHYARVEGQPTQVAVKFDRTGWLMLIPEQHLTKCTARPVVGQGVTPMGPPPKKRRVSPITLQNMQDPVGRTVNPLLSIYGGRPQPRMGAQGQQWFMSDGSMASSLSSSPTMFRGTSQQVTNITINTMNAVNAAAGFPQNVPTPQTMVSPAGHKIRKPTPKRHSPISGARLAPPRDSPTYNLNLKNMARPTGIKVEGNPMLPMPAYEESKDLLSNRPLKLNTSGLPPSIGVPGPDSAPPSVGNSSPSPDRDFSPRPKDSLSDETGSAHDDMYNTFDPTTLLQN